MIFFWKHHRSSQRQRKSNRGAKKRPPRRLRVAGRRWVTLLRFRCIQGTVAHGDVELLLLFYKHTSEFEEKKTQIVGSETLNIIRQGS